MTLRPRETGWLLALILLLAACGGGELEISPGETEVTLALHDDGVRLVDWSEVLRPSAELHTHGDREIEYSFYPSDGGPGLSGHLPDPRVLHSEFDENGEPDPLEIVAGDGLVEVRVPSEPGRIELRVDGEVIGGVDFDPDGARTVRSELMSEADVLGSPTPVVYHGDRSEKIDILFLPEGYTESDLAQFEGHVAEVTSNLANESGYRDVWSGINVWRQDVRSRTRGTGAGALANDTAFETARGISGVDRCVFFATTRGQQAAKRLGDRFGAEVVVVLVNSTGHGGCAGDGIVVTARPRHVHAVVAHELGHALFGLADEYTTPRPGGYCSTGPNVAASIDSLPWADMLTTSTLPTPTNAPFGTIGAFEGAGYCSTGRYRPTHVCMMSSLNHRFCKVCRREIERKMARYVDAEGPSNPPASTTTIPAAPAGMSPNEARVPSVDVTLAWSAVSGATNYRLTVEKYVNGRYSEFANFERTSTAAAIRLQETGGDYRWTLRACSSAGCSPARAATFSHQVSGSTDSAGNVAPPIPTGLEPDDGSVISDQTPTLSWTDSAGATHYDFRMMEHDGTQWRVYVPEQRVDSSRVSTTLRTPERWYAFAVRACNGSGCSSWTDYSTLYLRL